RGRAWRTAHCQSGRAAGQVIVCPARLAGYAARQSRWRQSTQWSMRCALFDSRGSDYLQRGNGGDEARALISQVGQLAENFVLQVPWKDEDIVRMQLGQPGFVHD